MAMVSEARATSFTLDSSILEFLRPLKILSHGAIFLATCNAILLLEDVKLANTCFHHSLLIYSEHIKRSSLIYIS